MLIYKILKYLSLDDYACILLTQHSGFCVVLLKTDRKSCLLYRCTTILSVKLRDHHKCSVSKMQKIFARAP